MSGHPSGGIELEVEGANKRDAGRGIARLPDSVRDELNVLSGDPIIVGGDRKTVVKVWPASDDGGQFVRIDADTRANAGVNIGDTVTVSNASVDDATTITVQPAKPLPGSESYEHAVRDRLVDRLVQRDEQVHVEGLGTFLVRSTSPEGSVRVADDTRVTVLPYSGDREESATASSVNPPSEDEATETADIDVNYEDIGGLDEELDQIREMIEMPLSEPERFRRLGIDPPSGVLLHGPPGTGKTLIARAVANEVDAYFDTISGPEIVSKYKGESEERLREAFERAEDNAPSILFIDEIDSIAGSRDEDADMENRVVAQLLTLMDGLEDRGRVVVIGATNRVDTIDDALRRGGRFDREIEIGVPDEPGRREILDVHTREMPIDDDIQLDDVASQTHGFVGADLATLTTEAAMTALRRESDDPDVNRADFETAMAAVEPSAMREYVAESPSVSFDDVGGLDDVKERLTEAVEWPLAYGPLFSATDTDPPSGVLLYGPPGTGKTLLARAIAGESGVNFIHVNGPELLDRYVGESEESVREMFERARQTAPSIVFLDEIDAVAGQRGESNEVSERVVSQLLTELDGITENPNLVVLAATNRRETLDDALLRPGRFEQHVEVPNPDRAARREILAVHTADKPLGDGVDLDGLAAQTEGYSGAQIEALVREASMRAIRAVADDIDPDDVAASAESVVIETADFEAALESV
ncbi:MULTISPECIES: CDC48 family AAA ATPase [Halomicrobium]|uniref:Vesicle-fusing ATPase n=2 Tax=Halomicrobium mukohataei TaxID=57705 RepID=C7NXM2_HALMD|nr:MULTISPECIES: CDC48 family AAA ATPase [Halomicrobium]ACV48456.1 Vesicle-fusing ATPase [Halomicrobium mukohataei DSM 12286]QCD66861.1 AAA family ATPase [Halomicrobium mukohataei]QFR21671.1 CDC48 family AAA ATPase [Halomicrobium sp. ZPS1]